MSPQWEYRYYSFDPQWAPGRAMASMRDGQGDGWFALLRDEGIAVVGLAHEAPAFRPGHPPDAIFADVPSSLRTGFLDEPAFDVQNSTFCIWRLRSDSQWRSGATLGRTLPDADGSDVLLRHLDARPESYVQFAAEYYEMDLHVADVTAVYDHRPIGPERAARLNPAADFHALEVELKTLGYPLAAPS